MKPSVIAKKLKVSAHHVYMSVKQFKRGLVKLQNPDQIP